MTTESPSTRARRPDPSAGSSTFETQFVRWLKLRLAESEAAAQRAAAAHNTDIYSRHDSAREVFAEVLNVVDPLGGKEATNG